MGTIQGTNAVPEIRKVLRILRDLGVQRVGRERLYNDSFVEAENGLKYLVYNPRRLVSCSL